MSKNEDYFENDDNLKNEDNPKIRKMCITTLISIFLNPAAPKKRPLLANILRSTFRFAGLFCKGRVDLKIRVNGENKLLWWGRGDYEEKP